MTLPIVLFVLAAMFPGAPPIQVNHFATEKECAVAVAALDKTTRIRLILWCVVRT